MAERLVSCLTLLIGHKVYDNEEVDELSSNALALGMIKLSTQRGVLCSNNSEASL